MGVTVSSDDIILRLLDCQNGRGNNLLTDFAILFKENYNREMLPYWSPGANCPPSSSLN